jgi:uncharacterized membrane protein (UPF0127 family)
VKSAAAVLLALSCTSGAPPAPPPRPAPAATTDVSAQGYVGAPLDKGQVVPRDAYGGLHPLEVEIADTSASRTRGMMWRTNVPPGTGMLFIFPDEEVHQFWMRNTLVPLDMLFLDKTGRVVGIVAQAEPQTLERRTVGVPSVYVLEVAGGWAEKAGVVPGGKVELKGELAKRVGQP